MQSNGAPKTGIGPSGLPYNEMVEAAFERVLASSRKVAPSAGEERLRTASQSALILKAEGGLAVGPDTLAVHFLVRLSDALNADPADLCRDFSDEVARLVAETRDYIAESRAAGDNQAEQLRLIRALDPSIRMIMMATSTFTLEDEIRQHGGRDLGEMLVEERTGLNGRRESRERTVAQTLEDSYARAASNIVPLLGQPGSPKNLESRFLLALSAMERKLEPELAHDGKNNAFSLYRPAAS